MKNGGLTPSFAEPEGDHFCISLCEITEGGERFLRESPCFLTQDVHLG